MAKPRIFVSSTYVDLKDIRGELARFIEEHGYEPVVFEKDSVPFGLNETLEESCYEEVTKCSMVILIIKSRFGSSSMMASGDKRHFSITRNEYATAIREGIPAFVFIDINTFSEYQTYSSQENRKRFVFKHMENKNLALFIEEVCSEGNMRFIYQFNDLDSIKETLKKQWAGLFNKYLENEKSFALRSQSEVAINSFKLFFFRRNLGISQKELASRSRLKEREIQILEDAGLKKRHINIEDFGKVSHKHAQLIADGLGCHIGNIRAGLPDDFLSQYLAFYFKNKGTRSRAAFKGTQKFMALTKVVLFDFDGTLTCHNDDITTWERIWLELGYGIDDCGELHRQYSALEITHKEWCKLTEDKFKKKGLKNKTLDKIAADIELVAGADRIIKGLYESGVKLYVLSGSIKYIIKRVLGDLYQYFEEVKANDIVFGRDGNIIRIIGTKYDFEEKATFIKKSIAENDAHPMEVFFVGNSVNDEWAHESGAQTICVNPRMTNPYHPIHWTHYIPKMSNFSEIIAVMNFEEELDI
ncbi:HAD-IB family phosphatase [Glaciecola sp. SC05]|uniref:HAD-IB family phosphatase n=1 Tax=Glaciecola sp. SC05 TaxID=1987355 RepID=UPI003527B174